MMMMMQWWWLLVDQNQFVMERMNLIEDISVMVADYPVHNNEFFRFDDEYHYNTRSNHQYPTFVPMEY